MDYNGLSVGLKSAGRNIVFDAIELDPEGLCWTQLIGKVALSSTWCVRRTPSLTATMDDLKERFLDGNVIPQQAFFLVYLGEQQSSPREGRMLHTPKSRAIRKIDWICGS